MVRHLSSYPATNKIRFIPFFDQWFFWKIIFQIIAITMEVNYNRDKILNKEKFKCIFMDLLVMSMEYELIYDILNY